MQFIHDVRTLHDRKSRKNRFMSKSCGQTFRSSSEILLNLLTSLQKAEVEITSLRNKDFICFESL